MPKALVLLFLFVGCGPIQEPECVEDDISCDNRCLSHCEEGRWVFKYCHPCGRSLKAKSSVRECVIEAECVAN
jgi:hypothetical protein